MWLNLLKRDHIRVKTDIQYTCMHSCIRSEWWHDMNLQTCTKNPPLVMHDIQRFCVKHFSHIDICQSEICLLASFHSCLCNVSPLCSLFCCVKSRFQVLVITQAFIIYIQSVFVLVSVLLDICRERKGLKCFWIKAHKSISKCWFVILTLLIHILLFW